MKSKNLIIASAILLSLGTFAQKDELKALKKMYAKEVISTADLVEYKSNISKLETLATEESDKVYTNFYKSMTPLLEMMSFGNTVTQAQILKVLNPKTIAETEVGLNATLNYEKKSGKKVYTDDIIETITSFKPQLLSYAIGLGDAKMYKESSQVLYSVYKLDKKDQENLYYAASYAVNGKDYENALKYYNELKALNYTGENTLYYAKNLASGKEEYYLNKADRDKLVLLKTHSTPRDEKQPSKKGEIYKNISLILVESGKVEEAKAALKEARLSNPDDVSLITTEADIYYKANDLVTYKKLISEAIEKNPNDAILVFNLGVISGKANQEAESEKYYKRALEIDPNYTDAYINLAELKLRKDDNFVKEMNKLGTSEKDTKKYDALKIERNNMFKEVMPVLEKANELDPKNIDVSKLLQNVYKNLELNDKAKALKAKM